MSNANLPFVKPPILKPGYVCWVDVMGIRSLLYRSVDTAAIIISQFQKLLQVSKDAGLTGKIYIYPVMDGAFITSDDKSILQNYLSKVYNAVAAHFIQEKEFFTNLSLKVV